MWLYQNEAVICRIYNRRRPLDLWVVIHEIRWLRDHSVFDRVRLVDALGHTLRAMDQAQIEDLGFADAGTDASQIIPQIVRHWEPVIARYDPEGDDGRDTQRPVRRRRAARR